MRVTVDQFRIMWPRQSAGVLSSCHLTVGYVNGPSGEMGHEVASA